MGGEGPAGGDGCPSGGAEGPTGVGASVYDDGAVDHHKP